MKREPDWSRDIATFRHTTHRSSRMAFRDADYACAIERGNKFFRYADVILCISTISALGAMIGAAFAWMI